MIFVKRASVLQIVPTQLYTLLFEENNHDDSWRVIVIVEKNSIRSSFPQQD